MFPPGSVVKPGGTAPAVPPPNPAGGVTSSLVLVFGVWMDHVRIGLSVFINQRCLIKAQGCRSVAKAQIDQ